MLQVVDSQVGRLAEADRAQVARDLDSPFVGGLNGSAQLGAGNEVVGLKRGHSAVGPELHRLARLVRTGELIKLHREGAFAFQIRTGDVHLRAGNLAAINRLFEFEIGVRLDAAAGSNRGNSAREVKAGKAVAHLVEQAAAGRVEHVVVHANQAGNRRVA